MNFPTRIAWIVLGAAVTLNVTAVDVVVVVSADRAALVLNKEQVAALFLGRTVRFPDGRRAVPIDQSEGLPIRTAFYDTFTGKSAAQLKGHWAKIIFTGRGRPPRLVAGDEQVKQQLALDTDAIAYLDAAAVDERVRVVTID